MRPELAVAATLALALLTGCGDGTTGASDATPTRADSSTPPEESPGGGREPAPAEKGIVVTTGDSEFGTMLFDESRQAIYMWESEPTSRPECYGDCAEAWPPVLTEGDPVAEGRVRPRLLGTTERTDGTTQVTYNDHPLYYYAHEAPGEVKCHDVATHGGLWWVVRPDGDRAR